MRILAAYLLLNVLAGSRLPAQNVVIAVVDGLRSSEGMEAGESNLPHLWNDLRPRGMIWTAFRNEGVTTTVSGHASILTGTWQRLPNNGTARPTSPTIFEYYRAATAAGESSAFAIVGKTKLEVLTHGTDSAYGAPYRAAHAYAPGDTAVISLARSILRTGRPRLVLLNLPDVDRTGHSGSWTAYIGAVRTVDSLLGDLWSFLEADSFYGGRTTMFVTNDHGRHDSLHGGFQNHGDSCDGCRRIMLLAVGRSIPAGVTTGIPRTQRDIAPAAGVLLGIPTPGAEGANLLADTSAAVTEPDRGSLMQAVPPR